LTPSGISLSYVLPLRARPGDDIDELASYLAELADLAEVIVVDSSPAPAFERLGAALDPRVRQLEPDADLDFRMGKVNGVITGVRHARHDVVVIADDDVRYDSDALRAVAARLRSAHLVAPQNYFAPLPWHAAWDTGRTLLNRVLTGDRWFAAGDFPGTVAVRKGFFLEIDAYDGDVIFENLELMRTVRAAGGTVDVALGLYVRRLPPRARQFASQRVRQAYDDFAIPARLAAFLSILPAVSALAVSGRGRAIIAAATATVAVAELGRRRAGGSEVYPLRGSLLAPAWVSERAICAWLAVGQRLLRGGTAYRGGVIKRTATPAAVLERRYRGSGPLGASNRTAL